MQRKLSQTFTRFFNSEKFSGILLIACTATSLAVANSALGGQYADFWHAYVGGMSIEHWINDALMAIFFLMIGLELERELYNGELSNPRNAILPIVAALGGIVVPAAIYLAMNAEPPARAGFGIPMATDIAFALGVLALLGKRVPASLKVFLTALAVMDDLAAIIIIAVVYTAEFSAEYLAAAMLVFGLLVALNRFGRVRALTPYLLGGVAMWYFMLQSGVHATIAGVLLAFAIPYSRTEDDSASPSHRLEHMLHRPVAFLILPLFALCNTGVVLQTGWAETLASASSLGVIIGLLVGKPLGITAASLGAVAAGLCRLPLDLSWRHVLGAGLLGGIGFTMSIFITNLAFVETPEAIGPLKIAILLGSLSAGTLGFLWLSMFGGPTFQDTDPNTMDYYPPAAAS